MRLIKPRKSRKVLNKLKHVKSETIKNPEVFIYNPFAIQF